MFQNDVIFADTIRENVTFGRDVSDSMLRQAAKDAMARGFIEGYEDAYDHEAAIHGANFSGGQRQRLEIARALATNPSLLVLDEATSALDPVTEQKVLENIRHRGCSCVIVAHRLSTIRDCDEIIVLERGRVMERGRHADMMQHEGPYRRLIEERGAEG